MLAQHKKNIRNKRVDRRGTRLSAMDVFPLLEHITDKLKHKKKINLKKKLIRAGILFVSFHSFSHLRFFSSMIFIFN